MRNETELSKKNLELSFEFSRYLLSHPELEGKISEESLVIFDVADDPELTQYNNALAKRNRDTGQPLVVVHIKGLAPTRLLEPEVTLAP